MRNSIDLASVSKRLSFIIMLIVIFSLLAGCSLLFGDPDDDTDDNDDFDNATFIVDSTNTWTGEISSSSDIDVFKKWFETDWYYIDMTDLTDDLDIEIWDSDEDYLNSSEEWGTTDERISQTILTAGYYYLVVYGPFDDESEYTITITRL